MLYILRLRARDAASVSVLRRDDVRLPRAHREEKQWPNPSWSDAIYDKFENWVYSKAEGPQREFTDGEEIKPLPPLDDKK